jgi:CRISPR-associated protein Csb2
VVRYVLDSKVLPLAIEALPLAEQTRFKLMGIFGRITEQNGVKGNSPIFSGKDAHGNKLTDHGHAYYLPSDEDGDGRLDHLTIFAENGFGPDELKSIDCLQSLKRREDLPEIHLLLVAISRRDELKQGPLGTASRWVSATPFLVTRHQKKSGRKRDPKELLENSHAFIAQVLREELDRLRQRRSWPFPLEKILIEPLYRPPGVFRIQPKLWRKGATGPALRPIQFKRYRRKAEDDGGRRLAGAFRIVFPSPVSGPIALGHSAHFGLGLFLPEFAVTSG